MDQEVAEVELHRAYLQGKEPEKIQAATLRMRAEKYELNKMLIYLMKQRTEGLCRC